MTVSATDTLITATGDGVTTVFSYPRQFQASTDLKVYLVLIATGVATLQTLSTHYSVSGAGDVNGGSVTFVSAPSNAYKVVIYRDMDPTQTLDLDNVTSFPMTSMEAAFDRAMLAIGELRQRVSRMLFAPLYRITAFDYTLPEPVASKVLGINSGGTGLELRSPQIWSSGAGDPSGAYGSVGDFYLNTTSNDVFEKTGATTWTLRVNIRGATGATGSAGTNGTNGTNGVDGKTWYGGAGAPAGSTGVVGDWYINTTTGGIYEKTGASTWTLRLTLSGGGSGDMLKATYDTDNDGIVDAAESVPWAGITGVPATFTPSAHTHTASNITDFSEAVDDRVAALLVAGTNTTLTYNDAANTLTVAVSGLTSASLSDFAEAVDDRVAALLVAGTNVTLTYNDAANTLTIAAAGGLSDGTYGDIAVSSSGTVFTDRTNEKRLFFEYSNDFFSTANDNMLTLNTSGTTNGALVAGEAGHPGVYKMDSSTSGGVRRGWFTDVSPILFGGAEWVYEAVFSIAGLSNGTNRFYTYGGFVDSVSSALIADGAMIIYDEANAMGDGSSANWKCVTANNSTRTITVTSVAVTTGWHSIKIVVNAAGTSVAFYIDNTLVATHTTNIPTATGRETGFGFQFFKTLGTGNNAVSLDLIGVRGREISR